jgi:hypothetical protein
VAPVEIFNPITRPSALPAVRAQVSSVPAIGLVGTGVLEVPQVHQVQTEQSVQTKAWAGGAYGISGSAVKDMPVTAKKRLDVRGVPPRGRPV